MDLEKNKEFNIQPFIYLFNLYNFKSRHGDTVKHSFVTYLINSLRPKEQKIV